MDQAENLRQIIRGENNRDYSNWHNRQTDQKPENELKIITVTSGKGGVGKTSFTVNFAINLAKQGKRVLILDADFGLSNVDILMGIVTQNNLTQVISGEKNLLEIMTTGHEGVQFISGGSGLNELYELESYKIDNVIGQFEKLNGLIDVLIIDTGAGVNENILRMISASDETILVMTPEPTSLMDSFALAKSAYRRNPDCDIKLVVNRVESKKEADVSAANFSNIVEKYLNVNIHLLGSISYDKAVIGAVKDQTPYVLTSKGAAYKDMKIITDRYLNIDDKKEAKGLKKFLQIFRRN